MANDDAASAKAPMKYFKSDISGLTIHLSYNEDTDEEPGTIRFKPYRFNDHRTGTNYVVGYLATDQEEAIAILEGDHNVTEIDKKEYEEDLKKGVETRY